MCSFLLDLAQKSAIFVIHYIKQMSRLITLMSRKGKICVVCSVFEKNLRFFESKAIGVETYIRKARDIYT